MKKIEKEYVDSYAGREGRLIIMIGLGCIAAAVLFMGTIYLIFFKP
jgi:hypothetical protein